MKLSYNKSKLILFLIIFIVSCKQKSRSELIIGTWDNGKQEMIFFKDNTAVIKRTDEDTFSFRSTYKLINNEKFIELQYENGNHNEAEILELTNKTLKLRNDTIVIILTKIHE